MLWLDFQIYFINCMLYNISGCIWGLTSFFPAGTSFEIEPFCFPFQTIIGSRREGEPKIKKKVVRY